MNSWQLQPGRKIKIGDFDPGSTDGFDGGKQQGLDAVKTLVHELESLQEMLYAEHKHKVLIVLQSMDTGGKDGTIRRVFEGVNPQGVRVASFKPPTQTELDHDYLWRIHQQAPAKGEIVIFNRSHYEEVLVVRVRKLVPEETWRKRYDQINDFERMLSEEGTLILKFFLHISLEEQKKRLGDRLQDETKQWKYDPNDLQDRAKWKDYMQAYEDVLNKTTTDYAPWVLVPADHKWYRDWVVAKGIVEGLRGLHMKYPTPSFDVDAARRDFDRTA
ncbi:MAG: PPK2 family polyphosphate kinase [Anaerolineae bacterium]